MHNEFTAIVEAPTDDDPYWIANCAEMPGAHGQGETEEECLQSLAEAINLLLLHHREKSLETSPKTAKTTLVSLG